MVVPHDARVDSTQGVALHLSCPVQIEGAGIWKQIGGKPVVRAESLFWWIRKWHWGNSLLCPRSTKFDHWDLSPLETDPIGRVKRPLHMFQALAGMDLLARTGYQMGKSPLLPLFAASVGAGPEIIGLTVAASTMTGMVLKPWLGGCSDRWGRRPMLWIGTLLFALVPFGLLGVNGSSSLIAVRTLHGLATANLRTGYGRDGRGYFYEPYPARNSLRLV